MKLLFVILMLACFTVLGCGGNAEPTSVVEPVSTQASPTQLADGNDNVEQPSDGDSSEGDGDHSSSSSEDDDSDSEAGGVADGHDSDDDDTVSRENPGFVGMAFDASRNEALFNAQPLDVVVWTMEPTASAGALEAAGVLNDGATLFNPMVDGEGAGFILYYKGNTEPLVLLLPDLGPLYIWETDLTVADMEHESEGGVFSFRAYSPLFMDVGPSDLEIRVFGYDGDGADALLGIQSVNVP